MGGLVQGLCGEGVQGRFVCLCCGSLRVLGFPNGGVGFRVYGVGFFGFMGQGFRV